MPDAPWTRWLRFALYWLGLAIMVQASLMLLIGSPWWFTPVWKLPAITVAGFIMFVVGHWSSQVVIHGD